MSLKDLTKNTVLLSSPVFVSFFLKIIRAKMSALLIGVEGVGIVSQLLTVNTKLAGFSKLSLNLGAKKLIVQNYNENKLNEIPVVILHYFILVVISTILLFILGTIFIEDIGSFFLGEKSKQYFKLVFYFFPIITISSVPQVILQGFKKFKYIALSNIYIILFSFLTFIPLIYYFGIKGVVININIVIIVTLIVFIYFALFKTSKDEDLDLIQLKNMSINKQYLKEITKISGISAFLDGYNIFVILTIRGIVAKYLGLEKIGIYSPIITWSAIFTTMFMPSLFQYIFPRYAECKTNVQLSSVINEAFRFVTFILTPFILFVVTFRDILITIFYSNEFSEAAIYLPLHFIGVLFFSWMRILKQAFVPTGRIKKLIPFSIFETTLYLLAVIFLVEKIGLWAWCLRYSLVPLLLFSLLLIYFFKEIELKIKIENFILMLYSIFSFVLVYLFSMKSIYSILLAVFLIFGLMLFISKTEKQFLFLKIIHYIRIVQNIFK